MPLELPRLVAKHIAEFTGRTWLLPILFHWIDHSQTRTCLLIGGPGTGKSMIVAWLAGEGPSPHLSEMYALHERFRRQVKAAHFCVVNTSTADPRIMVKNIVQQLCETIPAFGIALTDTLSDRLPISIKQHANRIESGGSQTGVVIEHLYLDTLSGKESFSRILVEPLKQLYRRNYHETVILLIDALDEAEQTIIELLAGASDLPEQVRILATTRDDPRVLKFYQEATTVDLRKDTPSNLDDVWFYVHERFGQVGLNPSQRKQWTDQISEAADGNFLYAMLVLNDLIARSPVLADVESLSLPKGLPELYQAFLNRELGKNENRWFSIYEPLLGLLAIAQGHGLTTAQLQAIIGRNTREAIRISAQYLIGNHPDGPFRLFHTSFADFLLEDPQNVHYHIDAVEIHRRLAKYYQRRYREQWDTLDNYGLSYLLRHILMSEKEHHWKHLLDEYGIRFLFFHLKEAGRTNEIGRLVDAGLKF